MKFVIAGSSGFLGTALRRALAADGHTVTRLVRRSPTAADESQWDPYTGRLDQAVIDGADVVVNLAGSPLVGNPHSSSWAEGVRRSRVTTTMVLADAIARSGEGKTMLAQNGTSWYGDHGADRVNEKSDSRGDAFLTTVTREWQRATAPAEAIDSRVCVLRTAPVVDRGNPLIKYALPVFRLGLGARVGDGTQYFPLISLRDWIGAALHLATGTAPAGVYNLCCPVTPTNAEFTDALAEAAGRRARLAVPGRLVEVAGGRIAPEALSSIRTEPAALDRAGYRFQDRDVEDVFTNALRD